MKLLLALLTAALAHGAPISWTATGPVTPITDGWFVFAVGNYGATFTASQPVFSVNFYVDTAPYNPGGGVIVSINGLTVLETQPGVLVQRTIEIVSAVSFTELRLTTASGHFERLNLTGLGGPGPEIMTTVASVPEPGTGWMLGLAALLALIPVRLVRQRGRGPERLDG